MTLKNTSILNVLSSNPDSLKTWHLDRILIYIVLLKTAYPIWAQKRGCVILHCRCTTSL